MQLGEVQRPKTVLASCVTRWSGTFYMLERLVGFIVMMILFDNTVGIYCWRPTSIKFSMIQMIDADIYRNQIGSVQWYSRLSVVDCSHCVGNFFTAEDSACNDACPAV